MKRYFVSYQHSTGYGRCTVDVPEGASLNLKDLERVLEEDRGAKSACVMYYVEMKEGECVE